MRKLVPVAFGVLLVVSSTAQAQQVVARFRVGTASEGMTAYGANRVAVIDGWDVLSIRVPPDPGDAFASDDQLGEPTENRSRVLFSTRPLAQLGMDGSPRGIAWVPTQRRFYFSAGVNQLWVTAEDGTPLPPLAITFLPTTDVANIWYTEGIGYLPRRSPTEPEALLIATVEFDGCVGHVRVIRLSDGMELRDIVPDATSPFCSDFVAAVAWHAATGRILAANEQSIYALGTDGTVVGPLTTELAADGWLEGLTALNDGRVLAATLLQARVRVWDASLRRRRDLDRGYRVKPELSLRGGTLRWDGAGRYLFRGLSSLGAIPTIGFLDLEEPRAVPAALASNDGAGSVERLPDGSFLVNVSTGATRGIAIYGSDGQVKSRICTPYNTSGAAVLPDGNLAVLRRVNPPFTSLPAVIFIIAPAGIPDPASPCGAVESRLAQIALPTQPTASTGLQVFNMPGSPAPLFLIGDRVYDMNGQLVRTVSVAGEQLSGRPASWLTGGPYAGNFAFVQDGAEVTIVSP